MPVLVKPSASRRVQAHCSASEAFRCETLDEVERAYADGEPFGAMVQELVPGGDEELYSLGSYLPRRRASRSGSSPGGARQTRPESARARTAEAVWVQEVVDQGLRFLRELGFHGISQVEFKRDPRDGRSS